ncbi:hypothetical protein GIB67_024231 [Kingdonia uniflora]|uniref:Uncharacterized protein n=1 Tax=Kingdonia uniflora TaxID=39325 RepID=A0A7J7LZH9_9MAGN|nr:hypothetical protein GIB67_024231 [Kingdonia uniflora]
MQLLKNNYLLIVFLLSLSLCIQPSITQLTPTNYCGKIKIQTPFFLQNSNKSFPFSRILLCQSQKLYFSTSLGLFQVSYINYKAITLTIPHNTCSSSLHFISLSLLSAGFPSPPQPNLLLFNYLNQRRPVFHFLPNCISFYGCSKSQEHKHDQVQTSCLALNDLAKLEMGFDPKDLNCSHYKRVYRE